MAGEAHLSVAEARTAILSALRPATGIERLPLAASLGRVLAEPLVCPMDVPPHDNSAMDGYAFDGALLVSGATLRLRVAGAHHAGAVPPGATGRGDCLRVMTGAALPPGLDTVVPQELVRIEDGHVLFDGHAVRRGDNRRARGEDLARGSVALAAGRRLRPADIGLAASLGQTVLALRPLLRVALLSTGDEIVEPGQPLPPGCVYDSNRASLHAALARLPVHVIDLGAVRDDPAALATAFGAAAGAADVVLTSGGVSTGDADHTRTLLAHLGEVAFWKVAMRPGRPFAFGPLGRPGQPGDAGRAWLFALPGNPVAALVTFYAFVREALLVLAGATAAEAAPPRLRARAAQPIRKRPGRTEFQRGVLGVDAGGALEVRLTGAQGAGILSSIARADALVVLGQEQGSVAAGESVEVWPFDGLV